MKEFKYLINGTLYTATLVKETNDFTEIEVNGQSYKVVPQTAQKADKAPAIAGTAPDVIISRPPSTDSAQTIKSPLPGSIISIDCKVGDTIKKGQQILILEAMKMENTISSDKEGTITEILVNKGDTVLEGAELVRIS